MFWVISQVIGMKRPVKVSLKPHEAKVGLPLEIVIKVKEEVKCLKDEETKLAPVEIKVVSIERFASDEQQTTPSLLKSS